MSLDVGMLTQRIVIERRAGSVDDWGTPTPEAWTQVARLWASVRHVSGSEAIRADAQSSAVKASIRIHYRTGITPAMRVRCAGMTYSIVAVMPDLQRREHVDLVCEAVS